MTLARRFLLILTVVALSACAGEPDPFATSEPAADDGAAASTQTPRARQDSGPPSEVKRPPAGDYVYKIVGLGTTTVDENTLLTERVSVAGDEFVIDVSNNRNDNTQQLRLRWEANRVVQLSNDISVDGVRRTCVYEPPLVLFNLPMKSEDLDEQSFDSTRCEQSIAISVTERASVKDDTGRTWATWVIEVLREGRGRTDEETHWFAPELGRDIRVETTSESAEAYNHTLRILRSYPAPV